MYFLNRSFANRLNSQFVSFEFILRGFNNVSSSDLLNGNSIDFFNRFEIFELHHHSIFLAYVVNFKNIQY